MTALAIGSGFRRRPPCWALALLLVPRHWAAAASHDPRFDEQAKAAWERGAEP